MSRTLVVRYGESMDLEIETDDELAQTATFIAGKAGHTPVITLTSEFVDKVAYITAEPEDTRVPLGEYCYQITVHAVGGHIYKYPVSRKKNNCDDCDGLPSFVVLESLDETEAI